MEQTPRRRPHVRPAVAYVLAMLYLMLFTVLAIGFCAASTMSMQIGRNDRAAADAQAAAESGMEFVKYHLGQISMPAGTSDADLAQTFTDSLARQLDGSASLNGHDLSAGGKIIHIPAENEWSVVDPTIGTRFRAEMTTSGAAVWVKVIGRGENESIVRAIQMRFKKSPGAEGGSKFVAESGSYEEVSP